MYKVEEEAMVVVQREAVVRQQVVRRRLPRRCIKRDTVSSYHGMVGAGGGACNNIGGALLW